MTHALGVCEGFIENDWDVRLVSGPGADRYWFYPPDLLRVSVPDNEDRARSLGPAGQLIWLARFHRTLVETIQRDDPDLVLIRYTFRWVPWLGLISRVLRRSRVPCAIEVNSFGYHMTRGFVPNVARRRLLKVEMAVTSRYDLTYVVSPALQTLLDGRGYPSPIVTVPNGVSSRLVSHSDHGWTAADDFTEPTFRCVYFGTFHSYYDFSVLVDAYRGLRTNRSDIELHLHGVGPELDWIREHTGDLEGVYFHGRYEIRELLEWLDGRRDILVLPPKQQYDMPLSGGLSTKLFEYMAMGLPLVASDQVRGVLNDGCNAKLYDANSSAELEQSLNELMEDRAMARRLARNVGRSVRDSHTWRVRCRTIIEAHPRKLWSIRNTPTRHCAAE